MWTREELKSNARVNFKRNYWPCVAVAVIMSFLEGGAAAASGRSTQSDDGSGVSTLVVMIGLLALVIGVLFKALVTNVLRVGADRFFVQNRTEKENFKTLGFGFTCGHYGNIAKTMFLRSLYIVLWSILFIIPGIYKMFEYLMVPYILAENPGMDTKEAFAISKRMMDGEKWNAFVLGISFIGWFILEAITCGLVGIFWVNPYMEATWAELYAYNKGKAFQEGYIQ